MPPLEGQELTELLDALGGGWQILPACGATAGESIRHPDKLEKSFRFDDFAQALAFVNRVGALAEEQGHHPDIHLAWGRVIVWIWTHKIQGLTESDFVLAAKIDAL